MKFITADKPVTTTHKKLVNAEGTHELSTEVEVPFLESPEEFFTFAGGQEPGMAFINNAVETAAKNGGRAALRNAAETSVIEELYASVREIVRNYAPQASSGKGATNKAKGQAYDTLKARVESGEELTREQLLELLSIAK